MFRTEKDVDPDAGLGIAEAEGRDATQ
jgi:hypothetical protein